MSARCPLPATVKCKDCSGRGLKWNPDFYAESHQIDCTTCRCTGRVKPRRDAGCSYRLRGMTGLQELEAYERHLRRVHPEECQTAMALRERAEHIAEFVS